MSLEQQNGITDATFRPSLHDLQNTIFCSQWSIPDLGTPAPSLPSYKCAVWAGNVANIEGLVPVVSVVVPKREKVSSSLSYWSAGSVVLKNMYKLQEPERLEHLIDSTQFGTNVISQIPQILEDILRLKRPPRKNHVASFKVKDA